MNLNDKPIPSGIKAIRAELLEVRKTMAAFLSGQLRTRFSPIDGRMEEPRVPMLSDLYRREQALMKARDVLDGVHVEPPVMPAASVARIPKSLVPDKPITVIVDGKRLENAKVLPIKIYGQGICDKGRRYRTINHSKIGGKWTIRITTKKAKKA